MGKGSNVSKTNRAREDAAKRAAEEGKGGGGAAGIKERLGGGAKLLCSICKMELNAKDKIQLQAHVDSKHPKETYAKCFRACGARARARGAAARGIAARPFLTPGPNRTRPLPVPARSRVSAAGV